MLKSVALLRVLSPWGCQGLHSIQRMTMPPSSFLVLTMASCASSLLYPRASETRDVVSLDGVWQFRTSPAGDPDIGFRDSWYSSRLSDSGDVIRMPVPCSFNDITTERSVRDYVGWVWYDRDAYVPRGWSGRRVVLRFGSVNYNAMVWVNGKDAGSHEGGHLPFELDVTQLLDLDSGHNWVTVAVNNTLNLETIPQGRITFKTDEKLYPPGFFEQSYNFEYFHYAGIHRSVQLYTTPKTMYIRDVTITTDFSGGPNITGIVNYVMDVEGLDSAKAQPGLARVLDKTGRVVPSRHELVKSEDGRIQGKLVITNASLWWPVGMHSKPGAMYVLEVVQPAPFDSKLDYIDVYREPFGIRTISWDGDGLQINRQPFYFHGFGKHEDANIVGRGLSLPLIARDINLIVWSGANSFRTSHYPYAEELLDATDAAGIVVIDESPAIGLEGFGDKLLAKHRRVMTELVGRDKNRPSVVMWSLGNEPRSDTAAARPYFQSVYNLTRALDPTRAITTVVSVAHDADQASYSSDIICINRYYAWYSDSGRPEVIQLQMVEEAHQWRTTFQKPVVVSEYGAASVNGLRDLPAFIWTEDYQSEFLRQYFAAFDTLRNQTWFAGEMVWNFADFEVPQEYIRPQFCSKGVFTRERKPKLAAYVLRERYRALGQRQRKQDELKEYHQ